MDKKEIRKHVNLYYRAGVIGALGAGLLAGVLFSNNWLEGIGILLLIVGAILMLIDSKKYLKKFNDYTKEK